MERGGEDNQRNGDDNGRPFSERRPEKRNPHGVDINIGGFKGHADHQHDENAISKAREKAAECDPSDCDPRAVDERPQDTQDVSNHCQILIVLHRPNFTIVKTVDGDRYAPSSTQYAIDIQRLLALSLLLLLADLPTEVPTNRPCNVPNTRGILSAHRRVSPQ